jgi:hypothetical protein
LGGSNRNVSPGASPGLAEHTDSQKISSRSAYHETIISSLKIISGGNAKSRGRVYG